MKIIPWQEDRIEEIISLWNKEIGKDFPITRELLIQNSMLDKNILNEGTLLALNDANKVVGFIVSKMWKEDLMHDIEPESAFIQVLLVDTEVRNKGVGSSLLSSAEEIFSRMDIKRIFLGSDPFHYFPGIPAHYQETERWFLLKGYTKKERVADLMRQYTSADKSVKPEIAGAEVCLLQPVDKEPFLHFLHRCFPGRWAYETMKYFEKGGSGREFVLLKKENRIIGFCRINDCPFPYIAQNINWSALFSDEGIGGIGPLGIDPAERGHGYGLAIVESGIWFLRQRGISRIIIDWTNLIAFYQKLGYAVWKEYDLFQKN
ncbi:GNAT family N-acetyltransferase [Bacillus sp. 1P06AnD]|uniref:GNAT family N-acetyltransferase n=1 Tax=Bacillus sp. 1P06AnD TaxID=3132208 RepID=UPI00399F3B69